MLSVVRRRRWRCRARQLVCSEGEAVLAWFAKHLCAGVGGQPPAMGRRTAVGLWEDGASRVGASMHPDARGVQSEGSKARPGHMLARLLLPQLPRKEEIARACLPVSASVSRDRLATTPGPAQRICLSERKKTGVWPGEYTSHGRFQARRRSRAGVDEESGAYGHGVPSFPGAGTF